MSFKFKTLYGALRIHSLVVLPFVNCAQSQLLFQLFVSIFRLPSVFLHSHMPKHTQINCKKRREWKSVSYGMFSAFGNSLSNPGQQRQQLPKTRMRMRMKYECNVISTNRKFQTYASLKTKNKAHATQYRNDQDFQAHFTNNAYYAIQLLDNYPSGCCCVLGLFFYSSPFHPVNLWTECISTYDRLLTRKILAITRDRIEQQQKAILSIIRYKMKR